MSSGVGYCCRYRLRTEHAYPLWVPLRQRFSSYMGRGWYRAAPGCNRSATESLFRLWAEDSARRRRQNFHTETFADLPAELRVWDSNPRADNAPALVHAITVCACRSTPHCHCTTFPSAHLERGPCESRRAPLFCIAAVAGHAAVIRPSSGDDPPHSFF